METKRYHVVRM